MPRGKNYVNNNKGMALKGPKKSNVQMPPCFYGAACTRLGCIYRHDQRKEATPVVEQSTEPCMAYLAGLCSFTSKTCRKKHPPQAEMERLIAKYQTRLCRYGSECQTKGCLYRHPEDGEALPHVEQVTHSSESDSPGYTFLPNAVIPSGFSLPAQSSSFQASPPPLLAASPPIPGSAWRPAPVIPPRPREPMWTNPYHWNFDTTQEWSDEDAAQWNLDAQAFVPSFRNEYSK